MECNYDVVYFNSFRAGIRPLIINLYSHVWTHYCTLFTAVTFCVFSELYRAQSVFVYRIRYYQRVVMTYGDAQKTPLTVVFFYFNYGHNSAVHPNLVFRVIRHKKFLCLYQSSELQYPNVQSLFYHPFLAL